MKIFSLRDSHIFQSLTAGILAMTLLGSNSTSGDDRTNLGANGNQQVADTFKNYVTQNPSGACAPTGSGLPRVMVTGFGLFTGVTYNISGTVVRSMSDPKFWPVQWVPGQQTPLVSASAGVLSASDYGGRATVRQISLNGVNLEVCFLLLDVKWDLAAAITLHEIARFQPSLVVMTGRGGDSATVEWGALNRALELNGFDSHGNPLPHNKPVESWIISNHAIDSVMQMPWNGKELAAAARPFIKNLGYSVKAMTEARKDNTYICNNISYAVLNGMSGEETHLAGNLIQIPAGSPAKIPVGFFHYPAVDVAHPDFKAYSNGVFGWGEALASLILSALPD